MTQYRSLSSSPHRPESTQCFCRDSGAESWNISLEVGLDKRRTPPEASDVILRQITVRKSAPDPKRVHGLADSANVFCEQRCQFQNGETAGQAFGGLFQEIQ